MEALALTQVDGGTAMPGDLCHVLSYPAVECCVVIEQRPCARHLAAIWIDSCSMTTLPRSSPAWTGTALVATPLGIAERDGLCSRRWRPSPRSATLRRRRGRRPTWARGCWLARGQGMASRPAGRKIRQKNLSRRERSCSSQPRAAAAHRRWCGPGHATRSSARSRQKNRGPPGMVPGCASTAGRPDGCPWERRGTASDRQKRYRNRSVAQYDVQRAGRARNASFISSSRQFPAAVRIPDRRR